VIAIALDPFQNIVNVGWGKGGKFAILLFNSQWVAGTANADDFLVDAPPVGTGLVHIYGNKANFRRSPNGPLLITSTVPFKGESVDVHPPASFTQTYIHVNTFTSNSFGDGYVRELISSDGTSTWTNVGPPPGYGPVAGGQTSHISLSDLLLTLNGWTSYAIIGTDGPESGNSPGYSVYTDTFNALLIFDLSANKTDIAPANTLTIGFTTGASPGPIPENADIETSYVWLAKVASFDGKQISDFVTDAQNRPTGWIGDAVSSFARSGQTSSTRVDIDINLTTLSVTGH
jgi:hypothetical protein